MMKKTITKTRTDLPEVFKSRETLTCRLVLYGTEVDHK
ncbi:hypothetical protein B4070_2830 [Bacillus subtilis]|nr:hypothetical protein B4070_2830 [Bacillus subtilis]